LNKGLTNKEQLELLELKFERKLRISRTDFFTFLKLLSPPEFNWNWHHEYCCKVLQDWITTDKHPFLMMFMPPQHQKSTMLTEFLPAWAFGQSINYQAILVMYNSTMAKKYNRKIQRIIETDIYKKIFPNTRLNEKNVVSTSQGAFIKNSEEFEIVGGRGFLKSVGVQGGIAGNPAKLAFMDDVIKNVAEGNSLTYRNAVYDWYTDELEARLHNDSKVAFTITRRHEDDIAGRLMKRDGTTDLGGKWKVIKLPAIKEDNSNPNDKRKIGEALFPELHSLKRLEEIKEKNPRTFSKLYQQRPVAEGGDMIRGEWFVVKKESELPFNVDDIHWDAWIDGAWTEKVKNDETAIAYTYFDKQNKKLYIRSITGFRKRISKAVEVFKKDARFANVTQRSMVHIEMKSSGFAFHDLLQEEGFNCVAIDNSFVKLGKHTRVEEIEPPLRGGKVVLIEGFWIPSFIEQCESFPNGAHDDKVDVLCYPIHEYLLNEISPYIVI
jgi:predicted phage terminase large subunit-like protein